MAKKTPKIKLPICSQLLKVRNRPNFFACKWRATYHWKDVNEGYNFALDFTSIGGLHTNL